jgi:acyl dehydratase
MGLVDGSAIAALSTEWKFVGAIKIGDTIHCEIEVLEAKQSKSKPDRGILNIQYKIINQEGTICQIGSMATMLYWAAPEGEE